VGANFQIQLHGSGDRTALFADHRPTRIADVWGDSPEGHRLRLLLGEQSEFLLAGVQSWMWAPMVAKGRFIGVIGVAHSDFDYFSDHHAGLAFTVANQAAITLINAQLYEQAQALAALQERQRLARNLHDAVNQSLFSAGLIAEVLPRLWEQDPVDGMHSLEDLRRLMRGAQADMRLLLAELRPSTLTDSDLGSLLRLLASALAGRTSLPVSVEVAGEGSLPANVKEALYRMCQEGMNNIAKHAHAGRVDIRLQCAPGKAELRIWDDGSGFDPQQSMPGHYGLLMMQERAAAIGAALSITSRPGEGTEVLIRWENVREAEGR